jgi:hypothetical protein
MAPGSREHLKVKEGGSREQRGGSWEQRGPACGSRELNERELEASTPSVSVTPL